MKEIGKYANEIVKTCKECNKPVEGRSDKIFCSTGCGSRSDYKRACEKTSSRGGEFKKCYRCREYKADTTIFSIGKYRSRMCPECLAKPRRQRGQPKKETGIEKKITMPKFVYDDSEIWEEAERIMNEN